MTTLEKSLMVVVAFLLTVVGFAFYERHTGAETCVNSDAAAAQKEVVQQADSRAAKTIEVAKEATDYAKAVADPVAPVVLRVCAAAVTPDPGRLSAAARASARADAATAGARADRSNSVQSESVGPELQEVGQRADAQVAGLQAYIRNVCQRK